MGGNVFFTADEHYGHKNIIKYTGRPFSSVEEMDEAMIKNHNEVVGKGDTVFHLGDFCPFKTLEDVNRVYMPRLNGAHIFLMGSHDQWLLRRRDNAPYIIERMFNEQFIVMCHYAMRTWARSHYNAFQIYGHSHGKLAPVGKQHDVGVDNNKFFPVSFEELTTIMATRDDNFNLVKTKEKT